MSQAVSRKGSDQSAENNKPGSKTKTRSRNGCPLCKAKRLKCDETKPECLMCLKNGRKCPGYNQSFRWSTKHEKSLSGQAKGPPNMKDLVTETSKTIAQDQPVGHETLETEPIIVDHLDGLENLEDLEHPVLTCQPPGDDVIEQPLALTPPPSADDRTPFNLWDSSVSFCPPARVVYPQIPRLIHDRSSLLVEEWFRHVCSMWSSFDSEVNLNRKLASETWSSSEAVMNCLQSMSATCLAPQLPYMKQVAVSYLKNAIKAIQRDLKSQAATVGKFPSDLLLALCCVGTAACWIDTKELGSQFLRETKALLKRINRDSDSLSIQDRHTLSFFNNNLIYWNMLVAVVSDEIDDLGIPKVKEPLNGEMTGARHASSVDRDLSNHAETTAMRDIKEAQEIEEEILGLETYQLHDVTDTGDRNTPRSHFVHVNEGYRLASLLQLYQTFPDLVARRLPEDTTEAAGHVPWDRWIVPLSLRLVNTLKKVPPNSGTRCITPLLYLSASTGLRFDAETIAQQQKQLQQTAQVQLPPEVSLNDAVPDGGNNIPVVDGTGVPNNGNNNNKGSDSNNIAFSMNMDDQEDEEMSITRLSVEVSYARRFIMERLSAYEHNLPPAPVTVAKELVKAIWAGYDSEKPGSNYTHWIDVMEDSNLRTIFG
ncbi:fungal-specific transcription factor domain-containing protein [Apiospora hydei]|uniref:Fungal-specific transcription factor domain-containing protein n=1 Tax=Apiospora hydei TaxID=1337664 RepID=A0ABR1W7W1_9PEZI